MEGHRPEVGAWRVETERPRNAAAPGGRRSALWDASEISWDCMGTFQLGGERPRRSRYVAPTLNLSAHRATPPSWSLAQVRAGTRKYAQDRRTFALHGDCAEELPRYPSAPNTERQIWRRGSSVVPNANGRRFRFGARPRNSFRIKDFANRDGGI